MARYLVTLALVTLLSGVSFYAKSQQFSLRHYTAMDGLPQSQVNTMVEDQNGYLWIGTYGGGLARFDGREFKVYTTLDGLLNNTITSLTLDSHQNLWIVHPRGISRFDGNTFTKFQTPGRQRRVRRVFELNDTILFQVGGQGSTLGKIYKDSVYYWDRPVEPGRTIYFGIRLTDSKLCFYLNDSTFHITAQSGKTDKVSFKKKFNRIYSMVNLNRDMLVSTDSGFFFFDIKTYQFNKRDIPLQNHVVAYDSVNKLYWTEKGTSLYKEYFNTGKLKSDSVFSDVQVTQILFDREGNTWLGTSGHGLYRYYIRDFEKQLDKLGSVNAVEIDKSGALWIGSNDIVRVKNGKSKKYSFSHGKQGTVSSIKTDSKGVVWVASLSGLGRYESDKDEFKWYTREQGISSQYITSLDIDEKDNIWCGTSDGGVNLYDGKKFVSYSFDEGLYSRNITAVKYHKRLKTLFAGSEFGLNIIKDGKINRVALPELTNTPIISINTYKDSLLIFGSSGSGMLLFDPFTGYRKSFSSRDGLPSNLIYFVASDNENHVWIGTEQGISRIKLDDNLEIVENRHYGIENGLTGLETNPNAYYLGKEKYFGLIDGLYQFNKNTVSSKHSYPLHLTGVEVLYGDVPSRSFSDSVFSFFKIPFKPVLPPDKNHISFYFNRVDKRNPGFIRYKYFLENFDKTWSQPTSVREVTYSNLPAGEYVLNVLALNKEGGWDETPLKYSFVIGNYFYNETSFRVALIVTLALVVGLYSFWRVRKNINKIVEIERIRQQEQESLRKEIARDFHDEMGNQLTRIINYVSLIKLSKNGHAAEFYDKVEESAKYLYNGTRDFIWSIDPVNDELNKLFFHIRDFGEKLFEEKGIQFRAYYEISDKVKVQYGFCREANLIFKEAMTNIFNHSKAENVSFIVRKDDDKYEMSVEDDGVGFSIDELKSPRGVKNMHIRAERIRSRLEIRSSASTGGTAVILTLQNFKIEKL